MNLRAGAAAALLGALLLTACSPRTIALRQTAALVHDGASALYEEPDPQLARESMGGQLKLLEVLLRDEPSNRDLLDLTAEGFNGYAFLFVEDADPARAKGLYLRGRDYAQRRLAGRGDLARLTELDQDAADKALAQARPEDAPALFWTAFGWASYINLSKDSPSALAELPKAVAAMERARQLAPDYHFAGADLFFGIYYASRPAILGGDVKKAQAAFQEARRRTGGKYLMTYVLEARYLAVALQDQELFKSLLQKVADSPAGQLPNARLTDEVAKTKARTLLEKKDDLF
jgi:hypothetical protein